MPLSAHALPKSADFMHLLVCLFICVFIYLIVVVFLSIYNFFRDEYQYIKLPVDIDDAKNLGRVLSHYKDRYYLEVLAGVFVTYILYPFKIISQYLYT